MNMFSQYMKKEEKLPALFHIELLRIIDNLDDLFRKTKSAAFDVEKESETLIKALSENYDYFAEKAFFDFVDKGFHCRTDPGKILVVLMVLKTCYCSFMTRRFIQEKTSKISFRNLDVEIHTNDSQDVLATLTISRTPETPKIIWEDLPSNLESKLKKVEYDRLFEKVNYEKLTEIENISYFNTISHEYREITDVINYACYFPTAGYVIATDEDKKDKEDD